jgi:hypothetical protein
MMEAFGMAGFDPKRVTTLEWVVIGAGGLALIDSFLPWFSWSVGPFSFSWSAWSAGFLAWFATLLLVAAGGLTLARSMGTQINLPVPPATATLGAGALATLLVLLRWLTAPGYVGTGFGLFIGLLCAIATTVASYLAFRAAGGDFSQLRRAPGAPPPTM